MNRRHFTFGCEGTLLAASLDMAGATTGLLVVSGGNELRCGPFGSMAALADKVASAGFPVLRFDRRGAGDSAGANRGFTASAPDIAAAIRAFRAHVPTLRRIVAFGNCDAASALMLGSGAGCDALVLANPWTFEPEPAPCTAEPEHEPEMPPAALRAHYLRRLFDRSAWRRLLGGKVAVGKLAGSLVEAVRPPPQPSTLAQSLAAGLQAFTGPATILLAAHDRTAQAFLQHWDKADPRLRTCPGASHGFVEPQARIWLQGQVLAALRSLD